MVSRKDWGNYDEIRDLIAACIRKLPNAPYTLIFGANLVGARNEKEHKYDKYVTQVLCLCGKELSPIQWQFFIVECLIDIEYKTIEVLKEFQLKDLTQVIVKDYQEAFMQLVFENKVMDYFFEKKKPRDAMLWCILTLFYKVRGKYPKLGKVNFAELDKVAEKHKFSEFHKVFSTELELDPDVVQKAKVLLDNKEDIKEDEEDEEDKRNAIASNIEAPSERMDVLNTLSGSKNLKADYKLVEKKLYNERQGILQGLVKKIQEKEDDTAKLLIYTAKIDEHLATMQKNFEKHKARVTKLRAIISSVEKMNNRIYQESHNKKALSVYLHKLITKFEITPEMERLLTQPQIDSSSVPETCEALLKINQMINDTGDFGEIMAVRLAKEQAKELFDNFISQFTKSTASMLNYVLSSKAKQTFPTHNAIVGYFNERKELLNIIHTHATEAQWKHFVQTLSEGLHAQLKGYCKHRQATIENMLGKVLLPKEKAGNFSFLQLPETLMETSKDLKVDVALAWQLIVHMDELEGNEEYWRKMLDPEKTGKTPEMGINHLFSVIYNDLQDNIIEMIEGVASKNPILYAPFYMAMLQLSDTYKLGSIPYKLFEEIATNVKDFETKYEFKSEALKKVVYGVEEACSDIFGDFLNDQLVKLDDYGCNTRQAGILLPVKNIMSMIDIMSNYCSVLREDVFNEFLLDLLNKFLQWLDGMANTQPKYYNIVMLENLHHILARLSRQDSWEEWRQKKSELEQQYRTNVEKYVKYIFEYQHPKFAQYLSKVQVAIISGDFGSLTAQSEFTFKTFDKMVKAAFGNFGKSCRSMSDRMKKHLRSEEGLHKAMWKELWNYVKNEYEELERIVDKYYPGSALAPTKADVEAQLAQQLHK